MILIRLMVVVLPWRLKRAVLRHWLGYELHPTAYIGLSWVYPTRLSMGAGAVIGHLAVAVNLDEMELGEHSTIGRRNWITGFPGGTTSSHFSHQPDRVSSFRLGAHSAVTKNHHIDCTNLVRVGSFVTVAGYNSQILTHSIDISEGRQDSAPIEVGDYCFVGTSAVLLSGSVLPDHSVLGARSVLNKRFDTPYMLYAGNPAVPVKALPPDSGYFTRTTGFVV